MTSSDGLYNINITVNGREYNLEVPAQRTLVDLLRYDLELTGTKESCGIGVCGVCTVEVDGRIIASCIALALQVQGTEVTTIEGLANQETLLPLQQSFIENGGFQCGICTPGQVIAAKALLDVNPDPSQEEVKEWMMGNLCRCTGYYQIVDSVMRAIEAPRR